MKKEIRDERFLMRLAKSDKRNISKLAKHFGRSKSDAVRMAIAEMAAKIEKEGTK